MTLEELPVKDPDDSDPLLRVHNMKLRKSFIDGNKKVTDYQEGAPCPRCHLPKDSGEGKFCKYCLGLGGDDDG